MKRESNIELLRIIAMMMVLLVHCNYFSLGPVNPEDIAAAPLDSFVKAFAEQMCTICVNLFILISGWFKIKVSFKGLASFLFQVLFYNILIICTFNCTGNPISPNLIIVTLHNYWFVPAYLILYAISPVLNAFIDNGTSKQYLTVIILFFLWEFFFGWATTIATDADSAFFNAGYSAISFIGLYLLAGFLRKHCPWRFNIKAKSTILLYLLFSIIPAAIFIATKKNLQNTSYCSPFVIAASVSFFLTFEKIKFSNSFINSLGKSAFAIYLIHMHPAVIEYYKELMRWAYDMLGGAAYLFAAVAFAVCFGLLCIAVDQLRILTWKPINGKIKALEEKFRLNL